MERQNAGLRQATRAEGRANEKGDETWLVVKSLISKVRSLNVSTSLEKCSSDVDYIRGPEGGWLEKTKILKATTRKLAEQEFDAALKPFNDSNGRQQTSMDKFSTLLESAWPDYLDHQNAKPSTRYAYQSILECWIELCFGDLKFEEIGKREVTNFMASLVKVKLSAKYQRNVYNLLKLLFELAVEYDLIDASPVTPKLHRPKVERRKVKPFSMEQAVAILECVNSQYQAAVWTLALSGVRVGELLGLRWCALDFVRRRISVTQTVWRGKLQTTKNESSDRELGMSAKLFQVLTAHRREARFTGDGDFVFCQPDGRPMDPDSLRKLGIYPALARAGVPFGKRASGCHAFRHLVATVVYKKTGSLKLAQEQLGHSNVSTTADIYTDVDDDDLAGVAEVLDQALDSSCGKAVVENGSNEVLVQ